MTGNLNEGEFDESNAERLSVERLLTAYFDNELEPAERAEVEMMLSENPDLRGLLDQWKKSGDSLRQLPAYRLGADFSTVVQSKIDAITVVKQHGAPVSVSVWDSQRVGFGGIVGLAALLLLTLFVFPSLVGDGLNQQTVAVVEETVRDPKTPSESSPKERPKPIIAPRNSSLPRNSGRVPGAAPSRTRVRGVEQVVLIQNATLADLEATLHQHEIRIIDSEGKTLDGAHFAPLAKQGMEAIHVVSQKARMRDALHEIAGRESVSVTTFTIPRQLGSAKSPEAEGALALQLEPVDFRNAAEVNREIEDLNQWFDLDVEDKAGESMEWLLVINSPEQP